MVVEKSVVSNLEKTASYKSLKNMCTVKKHHN